MRNRDTMRRAKSAKEEWVEQAKEMIAGEEPRSQVDKDLAKKMRKAAAKGEEE